MAVQSRDADVMKMVRQALNSNQTMLAYQPIVQTQRPDRPAFYEGLIRVLDHTGRVIPAGDFMPTVENTEMGRVIDCLALEHGLKALAMVPQLRLSINMSPLSIGYPRWHETLMRGLAAAPTVAERLILEITESAAMTEPEKVTRFMSDLQNRGISFALDDFGAGFTAFRYLKDFHFDIVKIDGQFIRSIHETPDNQVLTNALVSIAQHFEMFTVAEFVESAAEARYLSKVGIDCMQGFFFGVPSVRPAWMPEPKGKRA